MIAKEIKDKLYKIPNGSEYIEHMMNLLNHLMKHSGESVKLCFYNSFQKWIEIKLFNFRSRNKALSKKDKYLSKKDKY